MDAYALHHSDSLDLFQLWYQFGGFHGQLTISEAWEMFHHFPETRRRDIVTIATYVSAMQKLKNNESN